MIAPSPTAKDVSLKMQVPGVRAEFKNEDILKNLDPKTQQLAIQANLWIFALQLYNSKDNTDGYRPPAELLNKGLEELLGIESQTEALKTATPSERKEIERRLIHASPTILNVNPLVNPDIPIEDQLPKLATRLSAYFAERYDGAQLIAASETGVVATKGDVPSDLSLNVGGIKLVDNNDGKISLCISQLSYEKVKMNNFKVTMAKRPGTLINFLQGPNYLLYFEVLAAQNNQILLAIGFKKSEN